MLETVFSTVLRMSAGAAIVIPVVALLRLALKNGPKVWSYLLWLLVLVRLLCPVLPETVFSPAMEVDVPLNRVETYTRNTELFAGEEVTPAESMYVDPDKGLEAEPSKAYEDGKEPMTLQTLLAILWAAGVAAMLLWSIVSMGKLRYKLVTAVPMEKGVYLADHIDTPFVTGLIRPKIYLPSDLAEGWVDPILLHERYHIRRLDPVVKFLYFLALAVHWFNPMVWLAYRLMTRDMEMSCDEAVMKKLSGDARREYAQSLLCLATGRRSFPAPLAFGEGDTEQRIKNVLSYKKPAFWLSVLAVILCLAASLFILAEPVRSRPDQLEYPGLEWNMSPEEVMDALDITEEMITKENVTPPSETSDYYRYSFMLQGLECFGAEAKTVIFYFTDHSGSGDQLGLYAMDIYYPDGMETGGANTDMEAVRAKLTEVYGADSPEYTYKHEYTGNDQTVTAETPKWQWIPETRAGEYLTEEEIQQILEYYRELYETNPVPEGATRLDLSYYDGIVREYPLVKIVCLEENKMLALHPDTFRQGGMTNYYLSIDAGSLVGVLQFLEREEEEEEVTYDPAMLEYPGFSWGDSPEKVKKTLAKLGMDVQIGIFEQQVIQINNTQTVEQLTLIFVHTLDLYVETRVGIQNHAGLVLYIICKAFLVTDPVDNCSMPNTHKHPPCKI